MATVVTPDEYGDWREHPITKLFFKSLFNQREKMKEQHICGLYENKEFVEGKAMVLAELLDMKYDEFMEALIDN